MEESMRIATPRIWFNRHFSTIGRVLHLLRSAPEPLPIRTLVSHRHAHFSGYAMADQALLEPTGLCPDDYLDWCVTVVTRFGVTHLVPGHEQAFLTAHAVRFEEVGCAVVRAAPAEILFDLHRKDWVYEQLGDTVPLPAYEVVADIDRALDAIARAVQVGQACVKPCVSVYGKGFFRLVEEPVEAVDATVAGWEARLRATGTFSPHLVMRYLPGREYSIDVAARHGAVLASVIRRKGEADGVQMIVEHAELDAYAAIMVRRFVANGLVNIQFKEDEDGDPRLLEINPRASGGIGMSCLSGSNLPDIAYRAALFPDWPMRIPRSRAGIRVTEISMAVELPLPETLPELLPKTLAETIA